MSDGVAIVTLNRPHYRNAFGRITTYEVDEAFAMAVDDTAVGAIVLCGAGDHFCSGHDLGSPEQVADMEAKPYLEGVRGDYKKARSHPPFPLLCLPPSPFIFQNFYLIRYF